MQLRTLLAVLGALIAMPNAALAVTYDVFAYDENQHGLWLPDLGHTDLIFDPGSTIEVDDAAGEWFLNGTATSRSNPAVRYVVDLDFTGAVSGDDFFVITGGNDNRIKGNVWANQQDDWRFAEFVSGTITRVGGATYDVMRMGGGNEYWAQLGTGLNDKNGDFGLSTWIKLDGYHCRDFGCRGDINARLADPIPEPTSALAFVVGLGVIGRATRRRS